MPSDDVKDIERNAAFEQIELALKQALTALQLFKARYMPRETVKQTLKSLQSENMDYPPDDETLEASEQVEEY